MNTATRKKTRKPARPVTEVLLELSYLLHTTRVVKRPDGPAHKSSYRMNSSSPATMSRSA